MRIVYINISEILINTVGMYSLAIIMKYLLKEINCQSSGWFSNNIYMSNNNVCSVTLHYLLYNNIWQQVNYFKQTNNIHVHLLFVVLYETRYDQYNQYNYHLYYKPSIIDPFTLNMKLFHKGNKNKIIQAKK